LRQKSADIRLSENIFKTLNRARAVLWPLELARATTAKGWSWGPLVLRSTSPEGPLVLKVRYS
jgi:hypothetical protein